MKRIWVASAALGLLTASLGCEILDSRNLPDISIGQIDGLVIGSKPVRHAVIEVWSVDDAGVRSQIPLYRERSDDDGRFQIEIGSLAPPFVLTARGGVTAEHWSAGELVLDDTIHLQVVVTQWIPGQTGRVVISPLTTVAEALGAQRLAQRREEATYAGAVSRAHELLDAHFDVDLRHSFPAREVRASLTEDVRHALALIGLSAIVQDFAARSGRSIQSMNIAMLTAALVADARDDARLDGVGRSGAIVLGPCMPPCLVSANTLRSELARALLRGYVRSASNTADLMFGDLADFAFALAENREIELFGAAPIGVIDDTPPTIEVLPSSLYDERQDLILFDTSRRPSHVHDPAAVVELSTGFDGGCPEVHKHTNLLRSAGDNPLRWRFVVHDDVVGVLPEDVEARILPLDGTSAILTPTVVAGSQVAHNGSIELEVVALWDHTVDLGGIEGSFRIEIWARDRLGNEMEPIRGCWEHVPRAAPQWVGGPRPAMGPGSFVDTNLDNDDIVALFGGKLPPSLGKPLARFEVENRSEDAVYLTLDFESIEGVYERTWIEARAFLYEYELVDTCLIDNPPCAMDVPRDPRIEDHSGLQPLPQPGETGFFLALRVRDKLGDFEDPCAECGVGEARIGPQRRYEIEVVATTLDFLLPRGVDPRHVGRIKVGPLDRAIQMTGIVDVNSFHHCLIPDTSIPFICRIHAYYQLYRALIRAHIDIRALRIRGRTAPVPRGEPRIPQPASRGGDGTFADALVMSYSWSTREEVLPNEDTLDE